MNPPAQTLQQRRSLALRFALSISYFISCLQVNFCNTGQQRCELTYTPTANLIPPPSQLGLACRSGSTLYRCGYDRVTDWLLDLDHNHVRHLHHPFSFTASCLPLHRERGVIFHIFFSFASLEAATRVLWTEINDTDHISMISLVPAVKV